MEVECLEIDFLKTVLGAKPFQSCLTLCNPMDCRTMEYLLQKTSDCKSYSIVLKIVHDSFPSQE